MKTSDLIALYLTVPAITAIVGEKVCNSRVPTKDAKSGEIDAPFLWVQFRNQISWSVQNPEPGEQPMGKVYDVEAVATTPDQAEALRDAVYSTHGFRGSAGSAAINLVQVSDQADDYAPRSAPADAGVFVDSLLITVIGE